LDVVSGPLNSNIGNPLNVESVGGIHTPFGSAPGAPQHQAAPAHSAHPPAPAAAAAAAPINSPQAAIKTQPRVQVPATAPADIANQHIFPINTINPYLPKWTIRARVTHKSDMKTWNNQKGSGTLFSVDLLDETGEIRATMFQDAAQHFFPILVPGKVYFISKGTLKFANKRYSSLKNEYELTLDLNSYVVPADDDVKVDIPKAHFHFVPIDHINEMNKDDMVGSSLSITTLFFFFFLFYLSFSPC
jgi:replication factor A1